MRERLALDAARIEAALRELCGTRAANEAMILSTCHRTELYAEADRARGLIQWLTQRVPLSVGKDAFDGAGHAKKSYFYTYYGEAAVRHVMRVASGLDSMVLGEPEIFGQMKQAFSSAQKIGTVGKQFERLFPTIFSVTKQVRSGTAVGMHSLSLPYAIMQLAKNIFADVRQCRALLIGAGEAISQVATYLHMQGVTQINIANRSLHRAARIAESFHLNAIQISDIPAYLPQSDLVVSATSSELPLLGKGMVEAAIKVRRHRPMLMVDLAMPRDIEPQISALKDVYLYYLDDLQTILRENYKQKAFAMQQAEGVIQLQAAHFMRQAKALDMVNAIEAYRQSVKRVGEAFEKSALAAIKAGQDPQEALREVVRQITNKMMHLPTIEMRKAAYEGHADYLALLSELFTPVADKIIE